MELKLTGLSVGLEQSMVRTVLAGSLGKPTGDGFNAFEDAAVVGVAEVVQHAEGERVEREASWQSPGVANQSISHLEEQLKLLVGWPKLCEKANLVMGWVEEAVFDMRLGSERLSWSQRLVSLTGAEREDSFNGLKPFAKLRMIVEGVASSWLQLHPNERPLPLGGG